MQQIDVFDDKIPFFEITDTYTEKELDLIHDVNKLEL